MLRIKTIHMKDFGAFKGDQSFDLPHEEGDRLVIVADQVAEL